MKFEDQTFDSQDVLLDGNEYINCTFNGCQIVFQGVQRIGLVSPTFNACNWHFAGPAGNTLAFLAMIYSRGGDGQKLVETILAEIRKGRAPTIVH